MCSGSTLLKLHAIRWDLIIFDESHFLKNPKAQRTIAALGKWDKDPSRAKPALQATSWR